MAVYFLPSEHTYGSVNVIVNGHSQQLDHRRDYGLVYKAISFHRAAVSCKEGSFACLTSLIYRVIEAIKQLFGCSDWQKAVHMLDLRFQDVQKSCPSSSKAPANAALYTALQLARGQKLTDSKIAQLSSQIATYLHLEEALVPGQIRENPLLLLDPHCYYQAVINPGGVKVNWRDRHQDFLTFINKQPVTLPLVMHYWCCFSPQWRGRENELIGRLALNDEEKQKLSAYLQLLTKTQDFKELSLRPQIASELLSVLETASLHESVKEALFDELHDALQTCGDLLTLSHTKIMCLARVYQAPTIENKLDVILGVCRLELVMGYAEEKCRALQQAGVPQRDIDEVEIVLNCIYGLKEQLKLPVPFKSILFSPGPYLEARDIEEIGDKVQVHIASPYRSAHLLARNSLWQRLLNQQYSSYLEKQDETFIAKQEALDSNRPQLSDQEYLWQSNNLKSRRTRAQEQAYFTLTLPWIITESEQLQAEAIRYAHRRVLVLQLAEEKILEDHRKGIVVDEALVHEYYERRFVAIIKGELKATKVDTVGPESLSVSDLSYALTNDQVRIVGMPIYAISDAARTIEVLIQHPFWREFLKKKYPDRSLSLDDDFRAQTGSWLFSTENFVT